MNRTCPLISSHTYNSIFQLLLAIGFLIALGCASGGTRGTGGGQLFEGTFSTRTGQPVVGAQVTIVETGASATTDAQGKFSISTDTAGGDIDLDCKRSDFDSRVTLPNVSATATTISVDLELDDDTKKVSHGQIRETDDPHGGSSSSSSGGSDDDPDDGQSSSSSSGDSDDDSGSSSSSSSSSSGDDGSDDGGSSSSSSGSSSSSSGGDDSSHGSSSSGSSSSSSGGIDDDGDDHGSDSVDDTPK